RPASANFVHCPPPGVQYSPTPLEFPCSPDLMQDAAGVMSPPAPPLVLALPEDDELPPPVPPEPLELQASAARTEVDTKTRAKSFLMAYPGRTEVCRHRGSNKRRRSTSLAGRRFGL